MNGINKKYAKQSEDNKLLVYFSTVDEIDELWISFASLQKNSITNNKSLDINTPDLKSANPSILQQLTLSAAVLAFKINVHDLAETFYAGLLLFSEPGNRCQATPETLENNVASPAHNVHQNTLQNSVYWTAVMGEGSAW